MQIHDGWSSAAWPLRLKCLSRYSVIMSLCRKPVRRHVERYVIDRMEPQLHAIVRALFALSAVRGLYES
jgi:hypothetical protein